MSKIVITGATGMIGASLARLAIEQGYSVLCIIRPNSLKESNLPIHRNLTILYSDIANYNNITLKDSYDIFFHLAWEKTFGNARDDTDAQLKNVQYTLDAVHLAKRSGCSVFIGAGSQAEYGPVSVKLTDSTATNPVSGYGIAKYAAGKLSGLLCNQLGIRHNWMRVLSVYGSLDNSYTLISYVMNCLLRGIAPELTKCEQTWDYINEKDAASAFLAIAEKGKQGKVYTLGSGVSHPLNWYIEEIVKIINPSLRPLYGVKPYYENQPMFLVADIENLTRDTGWRPEIEFADGIQGIADDFTRLKG